MAIIKQHDKRSGITYVYESESYWDKEKKQPRSRRKLIGRLDETTGEIVPTDGRGRKRKDPGETIFGTTGSISADDTRCRLQEMQDRIRQLETENVELRRQNSSLVNGLKSLLKPFIKE